MKARVAMVGAIVSVCCAGSARAELAYFASGQMLSVRSHHMDGNLLVLALRGGGEMTCEPSLVAKFGPDEVPYPEDEPPPPVAPRAQLQDTATPFADIIDRVASEQGVD